MPSGSDRGAVKPLSRRLIDGVDGAIGFVAQRTVDRVPHRPVASCGAGRTRWPARTGLPGG